MKGQGEIQQGYHEDEALAPRGVMNVSPSMS